jgi:mannose-6-phosphate isomerase-like protein (cupin superfamily)
MEKNNLHKKQRPSWSKKDYFDKEYLHHIWNNGGSIILTKASLLTKNISDIGYAIEKHFNGACDAHFYCSKNSKGRSFNPHIDHDDNFLVHVYGSVKWTVANSFDKKDKTAHIFNLTVGDLLYIPKGLPHAAEPLSRRISVSVPLLEAENILSLNRNYYNF